MITRPRVLLIAEAANPEWVSVPLIGWSLAQALREVVDVHLVTQIRNREAILRAGLVEGQDFTAIDSEALARPLWKLGEKLRLGQGKGWTALQAVSALMYPYFERLIWKRFGAALSRGEYDIVHRITPLSPTVSSPIARKLRRIGVPFILGPLNGGVPWPKGFDAERRREREYLSYVRGVYKVLPGRRATLGFARAILAGSRHTAGEIPARFGEKTIYIPENAINPARFSRLAVPAASPLRACFIGRLVPYKGADILLDAASELLRTGRMHLDIIGDGPMMAALKAQATREGLEGAVTFHGWMEHARVQEVAAQSSLLAFPSIREFGGGVVLEAMALGLTPLVVDYAGPGELVDDTIGFKVPIGTREEISAGFRHHLTRFVENPALLHETTEAARARVLEKFTWQQKARQVAKVYDWVLRPDGAAPEFFRADNNRLRASGKGRSPRAGASQCSRK